MSKDIEELENLKNVFQKCADIVGKCIELAKKIDETEDEEEIKNIDEMVDRYNLMYCQLGGNRLPDFENFFGLFFLFLAVSAGVNFICKPL